MIRRPRKELSVELLAPSHPQPYNMPFLLKSVLTCKFVHTAVGPLLTQEFSPWCGPSNVQTTAVSLSPPPLHAQDLSPACLSNKNGGHSIRNCRASNFLLGSPFSSVFSRTFIRLKSIRSLRFLFYDKPSSSESARQCTVFQVPFFLKVIQ